MTDPITTPAQMREALDRALADYIPGIDRAVRFVAIDQVDMLAEFYLHNRALPVAEPEPQAPVTLTYTNWRGETAERTITPQSIWFGSTEWHPEPQWLLRAWDCEKQAERDFAMKDFGQKPEPMAVPAAQVRAEALDDAARAVSERGTYWWAEAAAAEDAGRKKLSLSYEAKALACVELVAAIRAMNGTKG